MKLIDILVQMNLTCIYNIFYPNTKEYAFFSRPHGSFSKFDHVVDKKASMNRYKNSEITSCILSDHHGLKLIYNYRNKRKPTHSWEFNSSPLTDLRVREKK